MYDSIKLKLVCVSSGVPRLFDAVQDGVADPTHSADSIGLNKKQIVAILYQLCYGLSESTRFSAEHLIGSSCTRQNANEIFHNLLSCNT